MGTPAASSSGSRGLPRSLSEPRFVPSCRTAPGRELHTGERCVLAGLGGGEAGDRLFCPVWLLLCAGPAPPLGPRPHFLAAQDSPPAGLPLQAQQLLTPSGSRPPAGNTWRLLLFHVFKTSVKQKNFPVTHFPCTYYPLPFSRKPLEELCTPAVSNPFSPFSLEGQVGAVLHS